MNSVTASYGQLHYQQQLLSASMDHSLPSLSPSQLHPLPGQRRLVESSKNVRLSPSQHSSPHRHQQRGRSEPHVTSMNPSIQHSELAVKSEGNCMLPLTPVTPYTTNSLWLQSPPHLLPGDGDEEKPKNLADRDGIELMLPSSGQFGTMQGRVDLHRLQTQMRNDREREEQGMCMGADVGPPCKYENDSPTAKKSVDHRRIPAHIEFGDECGSCAQKCRSQNRTGSGNGSNSSGVKDCKAALHPFFEIQCDVDEAGKEIKTIENRTKNEKREKMCYRACRSCYLGKVKCVTSHPGKGCDRCRRLNRLCVPNSHIETGRKEKRKLLADDLNKHKGIRCKRTEGCKRPYKHPGHCRMGETRNVVRARRREAKLMKLKSKKGEGNDGAQTRKKRRTYSSSVNKNRKE